MPASRDLLGTLYQEHQPWLRGWLAMRLGCREVAADLAQDTFLRISSGRDLGDLREPRAYLTTVARGLAANWCRRQSLERAYLQRLAALPEPAMPSAEQQALVREALYLIDAMLDDLPRQARQVFLLSQFEGLRYDAIAQRLGLSLSTVKRHMKRALVGCLAHAS
ncbi:MAG: sigma-70 family RNA polymerase sigma factor [Luteimonas sp.]